MTPPSAVTRAAARRLWGRVADRHTGAPATAAAAVQLHDQLRASLIRWIGVDGYHALFRRAHGLALPDHPILEGLSPSVKDPSITALAARIDSDTAIAAAMEALLAQMLDLLGRIIGVEMAVRLLEDAGTMLRPAETRPTLEERS